MLSWFSENQSLLVWLSSLSILTFIISLIALPWIIRMIPEDYFLSKKNKYKPVIPLRPIIGLALSIGKNLFGFLLISAGILMLFLPGQGLLTILAGMLLMDYPGKNTLEARLVGLKSVRQGINWIRVKGGQPPIKVEPKIHPYAIMVI